ncbi:alkaline phosphatase D family protein [Robiginitomaculum antarcticum]|uniref:alkaline phosphatase D family protein n=1 Tax=Robiginitomaculum antarcticum TaxID=437507 RepID=UPI00035F28BC|nr:alkaline phosphatase D family protein [Robiginitomaculum antarcticum]
MTKPVSRRNVLALSAAVSAAAACGTPKPEAFNGKNESAPDGPFQHGVASGDSSQDGFVIWTRVTPQQPGEQIQVAWTIDLKNAVNGTVSVQSGQGVATAETDYTFKVVVTDLSPGENYTFGFAASGQTISGQAKTLPSGDISSAQFAVVSCANFQSGYFNVYDHIARRDDIDAVLHLGDYYYEYGPDGWGGGWGESNERVHEPRHELITLSDYRGRHAQYRGDANLQAMTARHIMIPVWDDHETSNDSWSGGAQNHQEDEGEWITRRNAAMQAYYEWMPIREPADIADRHKRVRSYSYGDLATLCAVETRLTARAEPINIDDYTKDMNGAEDAAAFKRDVLNAPDRPMMGDEQTAQVVQTLTQSKAAGQPWRILLNQVVMGRVLTADLGPYVNEEAISALEADWPAVRDFVRNSGFNLPVYPDSWDGYPWAREQFYGALQDAGITDIVTLTGDAHEFWANDLTRDNGVKMGVELVTTSVTSPTLKSYFGDATADYNLLVTQANEDVRYYNALNNGYMTLTLTPKKAVCEMIIVDTVTAQDYSAQTTAQFSIRKRKDSLKFSGPRGLSIKQRALFAGLG